MSSATDDSAVANLEGLRDSLTLPAPLILPSIQRTFVECSGVYCVLL